MSILPISDTKTKTRSSWLGEWQLGIFVAQSFVLYRVAGVLLGLINPSLSWQSLTLVQYFYYGFDYLTYSTLLTVIGIALLCKVEAKNHKNASEGYQDILQSVESAVRGDCTRLPSDQATGEAGQLAQAVSRLINVLSRSEDTIYHLSALVESSGEAIVSLRTDGSISSWNKGAQRIYGYSAEEVKNKSIAMLSPADDGAELERQLALVCNGERIQPFEMRHQARNGRTVTTLLRLSAILDSTHQTIGICFCAQELTDSMTHQASAVKKTETVDQP